MQVKNIPRIELGRWDIDCWYYAPYPESYRCAYNNNRFNAIGASFVLCAGSGNWALI